MTLEEYLRQKTSELAAEIASEAPIDSCPECNLCEGQLVYEHNAFCYECRVCGLRWSAETLEIDVNGKFLALEWAD
jgi:hypothetical protein